jgi:PIF1-like helicase/Helicase
VIPRGTRAETVDACIQSSFIWPQLEILSLTENMRVRSADPQNRRFLEWTSRLSYGPSLRGHIEPLPDISRESNYQDLIERVYPKQSLATANDAFFKSRSILASRNTSVREINNECIERFPGEVVEYLSDDSADLPDNTDVPPPEVLHTFNVNGLPPSRLRLKVGMPVMLLRNINPEAGLCNGTRLVITRLGRKCVEARGITGKAAGTTHFIPRVKLTSNPRDLGFLLTRNQFPLQVCFAMTINKSQGQTFDILGVDLRFPVFAHGQLYVAMSRVTDVRNLCLLLPEGATTILNIVYPEVLIRRWFQRFSGAS